MSSLVTCATRTFSTRVGSVFKPPATSTEWHLFPAVNAWSPGVSGGSIMQHALAIWPSDALRHSIIPVVQWRKTRVNPEFARKKSKIRTRPIPRICRLGKLMSHGLRNLHATLSHLGRGIPAIGKKLQPPSTRERIVLDLPRLGKIGGQGLAQPIK
jgi:hypothetical protein